MIRSGLLILLATLCVSLPLPADDAFRRLAQIRDAYGALDTYHDRGMIVLEDADTTRTLTFETTVDDAGGFRLVLTAEYDAPHRVLWRDATGTFLFDHDLGQYQPLRSAGTGIVVILGQGGIDSLVVAATVGGSRAALEDPERATLEKGVACGASTCYALRLLRMGETMATRLLVDSSSHLIREVEVEFHPADGAWSAATQRRRIRVFHEVDPTPGLATFTPPPEARQVEEFGFEKDEEVVGAPATTPPLPGTATGLVFDDEISIELISLVVRAISTTGEPLRDLEPDDFRVTSRGDEVRVVAVDWVSSDPAQRNDALLAELARHGVRLPPAEKHVLFFVQPGRIASRISGQMRSLPAAAKLVATLSPNDRAAVVTLSSHLKVWVDFTRRHDEVSEALAATIRFGAEPRLRRRGASYLSEHLDSREARDATTPERALEVLAQALTHVPGEKVLIFLGWGLDPDGGGPDYTSAVRALVSSRTMVFVLDVTTADYHTLEEGLRAVATATGGFYEKTHLFPEQATARVARAISGHYVLLLDRSDLAAGDVPVRVRLRAEKGRILVIPGTR
jgi:VWFA-related protein